LKFLKKLYFCLFIKTASSEYSKELDFLRAENEKIKSEKLCADKEAERLRTVCLELQETAARTFLNPEELKQKVSNR